VSSPTDVRQTLNGLSMDLINYRLCTHIINRECHRLPWGFPGQPIPASTGVGFMGMGGVVVNCASFS